MKRHFISVFVVLSFIVALCGCEKNASPDDSSSYSQTSNATSSITDIQTPKPYEDLTNSEKKQICEYIQSQYDYYDKLEGGYAGDKYSDQIWEEVMDQYGLEEWQVTSIWNNYYSY